MKTNIGSDENKGLSKKQAQLREQGPLKAVILCLCLRQHKKGYFICPNINSANEKVIEDFEDTNTTFKI